MRIALRTSGGRGEYELAGHQADVAAPDLFDHELAFQLTPELVLPGGQSPRHVQGKPRIRLDDGSKYRHAYRLLAAALLLPQPKRELRTTATSDDFVRDGGYAITDIDVDVAGTAGSSTELRPTRLWLRNATGLVRAVDVPERMAIVQAIWDAARPKTSELAQLVRDHEDAVAGGDHREIERAAAELRHDLAASGDVVDVLAAAVGAGIDVTAVSTATGTVPEDPVDDETEPREASRRAIARWRKIVERGAAGRIFAQRVRAAYQDRCAISGTRLPKLQSTVSAGVDSAHILPWARYELNAVKNGICLNKLCHWAFDAGVIRIDHHSPSGTYIVSVPDEVSVEAGPGGLDLAYFEQFVGPIPSDRLPASTSHWPSPDYIEQLNLEMYGS